MRPLLKGFLNRSETNLEGSKLPALQQPLAGFHTKLWSSAMCIADATGIRAKIKTSPIRSIPPTLQIWGTPKGLVELSSFEPP